MISKMRRIWFLLLLTVAVPLYSVSLPFSKYFPIKTDFNFQLVSKSGSQIAFKSKIEIPEEAKEMGHVFVNWDMAWTQGDTVLNYRFRFRVSDTGDFYLVAIHDGIYYRSITDDVILFNNNPRNGTVINIGEGISMKYVDQWYSRQIGGKTWSGVLQVELTMNDRKIQLYLAQGAGIIAIKSDEEIYYTQS